MKDRAPEAKQLFVRNADAGSVINIVYKWNHFINKVGMLYQVVICFLPGTAEIIERNVCFDSSIGQ